VAGGTGLGTTYDRSSIVRTGVYDDPIGAGVCTNVCLGGDGDCSRGDRTRGDCRGGGGGGGTGGGGTGGGGGGGT